MNSPLKISLVTTCKGRLAYLKESIPSWLNLDYDNYDIIVVDYDCPDETAAFLNKKKEDYLKTSKAKNIQVVKVKNKPYFNLNDARNIGIHHAGSELVLMIDSDMHIKDKRILRKIERGYLRGIIFFSNLPILNSRYFEAAAFYKILYHQTVTVPAILPLVSERVGSSGTACFLKHLYEECGKYNPEVNKLGYGCDDIEFYLRYLNTFFYNHYLPQNSTKHMDEALDEVLARFYTFPRETFLEMENPEEEKDQFYPEKKNASDKKTFAFINRFFETFKWPVSCQPSNDGEPTARRAMKSFDQTFSKGREPRLAKMPPAGPPEASVPSWFHPWFCYWYGQKLFEEGKKAESKQYLNQLIQFNNVKADYLANAHFYLGEIEKSQGNKDFEAFYKKSLSFILPKKGKSEKDLYFIASMYKRLRDFRKARQWFKRILAADRGTYLHPGVYFHLGEMAFFEQKYDEARIFFEKTLSIVQDHRKAADYIMVIDNRKR